MPSPEAMARIAERQRYRARRWWRRLTGRGPEQIAEFVAASLPHYQRARQESPPPHVVNFLRGAVIHNGNETVQFRVQNPTEAHVEYRLLPETGRTRADDRAIFAAARAIQLGQPSDGG